jgi:hypothetical protein
MVNNKNFIAQYAFNLKSAGFISGGQMINYQSTLPLPARYDTCMASATYLYGSGAVLSNCLFIHYIIISRKNTRRIIRGGGGKDLISTGVFDIFAGISAVGCVCVYAAGYAAALPAGAPGVRHAGGLRECES